MLLEWLLLLSRVEPGIEARAKQGKYLLISLDIKPNICNSDFMKDHRGRDDFSPRSIL
jgi:hypothetical protein